MEHIYFECTHCEKKKKIDILSITPFYITGDCPTCRKRITINRKMLDLSNAKKGKKMVLSLH